LVYPYDWGFVPSTTGEDGDPVDAALFWDVATFPGVVVPCRALAVIQVEQNRADGKGRARYAPHVRSGVRQDHDVGLRGNTPGRALRDCGINAFLIVGVAMEVGIEPTVRHGADLGYIPIIVTDAGGCGHAEAAERSLASLRYAGDALFTDVAGICDVLHKRRWREIQNA
jgi:Inorganic pyrophosphatase/Isochorismatase family